MTRLSLPLLLLVVAACQQPSSAVDATAARSDAGHSAAMPDAMANEPVDLPGLHNVVRYTDDVVSGAVPAGDEGFATLAAMGIHTIISVDGATPDVELAERHGLRYVHLPISYDGVPDERAAGLAQALTSLEGPFYVHCHHGKHRSAAAAGTGIVGAGLATNEAAAERMKVSGTSQNYPGLWAAVAGAHPLAKDQLRCDPASFAKIAKVSGMVEVMAELDVVFDNVKTLSKSSWKAPADHPDLVPTKETRRLLDLFTALEQDPESLAHESGYQEQLAAMIRTATELDQAVRDGDADTATARFEAVGKGCKECHKPYRDR